MKYKRTIGFWILIITGITLLVMYVLGQSASLINYDFTVSIGLQEPRDQVGEVGVAISRGFAIGDTIIYVPLLILGILGLFKRKAWGMFAMVGALAVTIYWPIVNLFYMLSANKLNYFNIPQATVNLYMILLPLISFYGIWGTWYLYTRRRELVK